MKYYLYVSNRSASFVVLRIVYPLLVIRARLRRLFLPHAHVHNTPAELPCSNTPSIVQRLFVKRQSMSWNPSLMALVSQDRIDAGRQMACFFSSFFNLPTQKNTRLRVIRIQRAFDFGDRHREVKSLNISESSGLSHQLHLASVPHSSVIFPTYYSVCSTVLVPTYGVCTSTRLPSGNPSTLLCTQHYGTRPSPLCNYHVNGSTLAWFYVRSVLHRPSSLTRLSKSEV
jgi:hypothetical protein